MKEIKEEKLSEVHGGAVKTVKDNPDNSAHPIKKINNGTISIGNANTAGQSI